MPEDEGAKGEQEVLTFIRMSISLSLHIVGASTRTGKLNYRFLQSNESNELNGSTGWNELTPPAAQHGTEDQLERQ